MKQEHEAEASADGHAGAINESDGDKVRVREARPSSSLEFRDGNAQTRCASPAIPPTTTKYIVMPMRM